MINIDVIMCFRLLEEARCFTKRPVHDVGEGDGDGESLVEEVTEQEAGTFDVQSARVLKEVPDVPPTLQRHDRDPMFNGERRRSHEYEPITPSSTREETSEAGDGDEVMEPPSITAEVGGN